MTEEQEGAKPLSELTYEELVAYLDTGWPWPLDAVQEWFEQLWDNIQEWIYEFCKDAVEYVLRVASDIWDTLKDKVTDVIEDFFEWATWFWNKLSEWVEAAIEYTFKHFTWFWEEVEDWFDWVWGKVKDRFNWLADEIEDLNDWLWEEIEERLQWLWDKVKTTGDWLWENISFDLTGILGILGPIPGAIAAVIPFLTTKIEDSRDSMVTVFGVEIGKVPELFKTHVEDPLTDFFDTWIADMLAGLGSLWDTVWSTLQTWWTVVTEFFTEDLVPGIVAGFKWISDWFAEAIDSVMDSMFGWLRAHSPLTPEDAPSSAIGLMTVLGISGVGLGVMTAAGQLMHPLATWNLGHLSAMIGDIVNYRSITGVIMGTLIGTGIGTPLRYYVNDLLRPWILRQQDFFELMCREAFTQPEILRTPGLVEAVKSLPGGGGEATEAQYIGYYGYPKGYHGIFRELANTRLGYFPLAGIARTGWWDPLWFQESVQRTGYSIEARKALMKMYEEMVRTAKLGPCFFQLRRLFRDHFITAEERKAHLDAIEKQPDLPAAREYAMDLEREYEIKALMEDIITRSFTRGVTTEEEAISELRALGLPDDIAKLEMVRERLGVMKRITIEPAALPQLPEVIPEGEY